MPANTVLNLVDLDPDLNRSSLIAYLRTQARFQGYDFAGDDISVILDILGVNTYRNGFLLNMAISEGFIDSAQLQNDIKSHAKELNYTPRSMTSSVANVTVSFTATGESQPYVIPKGATFASSIKNQNFTYSISEPLIVSSPNNQFTFSTNLYEGIYVKDTFFFDTTLGTPLTYQISNANVDTSSIVVNVFGNNAVVGDNYNLATSLLDLTSNSFVYFLQCAAANGNYEVLFGDGIFGHQPLDGSLVVIDYRVTNGTKANGSGTFDINFDPTGANELTSSVVVVTNQSAIGGGDVEDIETTRFYAPRWFQVQERAIVPNDYEILLKQKFPEINAVHAYGGETLPVPQFGKVIIAIDLEGIVGIPDSKLGDYYNFIKGRNPISIQPLFISASHTYIRVDTRIKYNINVTVESDATIKSVIAQAINIYNTNNLNDFDTTFYYSQFCDVINDADPSIISNLTNIFLYQKINPLQTAGDFNLDFDIALLKGNSPLADTHSIDTKKTLSSTSFYFQGNLSQLEDDGNGVIRIVNIEGTNLTTATNIGTIDYDTGEVNINGLSVDSYSGSNLLVYVLPRENDVSVMQNAILSIEADQTNITVIPISTAGFNVFGD